MQLSAICLLALLAVLGQPAASIRPRLLLPELVASTGRLYWPTGPAGDQPTYPYAPTPPAHGADELPLTSGMIVNLQSHVLQTFCNVADASADLPYALQCSEVDPSLVNTGLLVVGHDFTTGKLFDGSKITLKSQRDNKICSYGEEDQRFRITCGDVDDTPTSVFVIKRAKARADLFYIAPAIIPSHRCYPANSSYTHGVGPETGVSAGDSLDAHHVMVCDGEQKGDNDLLLITATDWVGPNFPNYPGGYSYPPYPGGGQGPPSSSGDDPSPDSGYPGGYPYQPSPGGGQEPPASSGDDPSPDSGGYPYPPYRGGPGPAAPAVSHESLWSWVLRKAGMNQATLDTVSHKKHHHNPPGPGGYPIPPYPSGYPVPPYPDGGQGHQAPSDAVSHKKHHHNPPGPGGYPIPPYPSGYPVPPYPDGGQGDKAPSVSRESWFSWVLRVTGMNKTPSGSVSHKKHHHDPPGPGGYPIPPYPGGYPVPPYPDGGQGREAPPVSLERVWSWMLRMTGLSKPHRMPKEKADVQGTEM